MCRVSQLSVRVCVTAVLLGPAFRYDVIHLPPSLLHKNKICDRLIQQAQTLNLRQTHSQQKRPDGEKEQRHDRNVRKTLRISHSQHTWCVPLSSVVTVRKDLYIHDRQRHRSCSSQRHRP